MQHIENLNIEIPQEFTTEMWNHCNNKKATINISYEFDGVITEVFLITATTTRHRNINWSDKLYAFINREASNHAKEIYGRSNAKILSRGELLEQVGLTTVQIAEMHNNSNKVNASN